MKENNASNVDSAGYGANSAPHVLELLTALVLFLPALVLHCMINWGEDAED